MKAQFPYLLVHFNNENVLEFEIFFGFILNTTNHKRKCELSEKF